MEIQRIIEIQNKAVRAITPSPEAAGIGGSWGKCSEDQYSDIDYFLLYSNDDFFFVLERFPSLITHPLPVMFQKGPSFVQDFGCEYSYILKDGITIDYFINCHATMNLNPMRAHTNILYDHSGALSHITEVSQTKINLFPDSAKNALYDYINRLLKIRKYAYRKDRPAIYYNVSKMMRIMAGIDRALNTKTAYNPFQAEYRLRNDFGEHYEKEYLSLMPFSSEITLTQQLNIICERITIGIKNMMVDNGANCFDTWELERQIKSEIIAFIRVLS